MRKLQILFIFFFTTYLSGFSHPWNPSRYVVIDTDGGMDDYRALCLLLSTPDIRVLAVTTSSGVLSAENTAVKVKALLNSLHHEGIPVAINLHSLSKDINCPTATGFSWGDENQVNVSDFILVDSLVSYLLRECREKIDVINLGSLSTAYYLMTSNNEFIEMVDHVFWSSEALFPLKGFNYENDTTAVGFLTKLNIPIYIIQGEGKYSSSSINAIESLNELTAQKLCRSFSKDVLESPFGYKMFDEMVAVFLHYPEKFLKDSTGRFIFYRMSTDCKEKTNDFLMDILKENSIFSNQIINKLPLDTSFYKPDVHTLMEEIVTKHGVVEWNAVVMTFELHRHVGTYALIGAKMGIRAIEYFGAGIDEMKVCSYAGLKPPLSCMNDGIQVSTGATLGHGLIQVVVDNPMPAAEFTYMGRTMRIKLRDGIFEKVSKEIKRFVKKYGLNNDEYWDAVRENAIYYWLSLNRHEIFDISNFTD